MVKSKVVKNGQLYPRLLRVKLQSNPCHLCHGPCVLGKDTSPTLPYVNVYNCCMFQVVDRGAVGAEWQPCFRQFAPGQLWLLS